VPRVWVRSRLDERDPESVLRRITDFRSWTEASELVRGVKVTHEPDGTETSTWEVVFGAGLLRWSERDWLELDENRARFEMIEGDPYHFDGFWHVKTEETGSILTFDADFDLGMPSLAHVLDPIAVEAVEQAIESVLQGLYGDALEIEFTAAAPTTSLEI
jgi:hypothetical protein